ncbi:MAG: hypothetical protein K6T66_14430 [Peptococcaceae bacterium]|nr:hypothetical protein [Peptococcaceae bacterium]
MPYYLTKVVGTGTEDDPRRPYISKFDGVAWAAAYDDPPSTRGCLVFCPNPTPEMEADPYVKRVSKANLDDFYSSTEFDRLKQFLADHGVTDASEINRSDYTCRQILNWIGRKISRYQGFDLNRFIVAG